MLNMQIKKRVRLTLLFIGLLSGLPALFAQNPTLSWHGISHELRYQPDGTDFVITNGKLRFNRALYGTNTAFRVEAGDLPEFALYLPGMGGNLRFGLIGKTGSKWLIDAKNITSRYRPGSMLYTITDPILGNGNLQITVLALGDAEGVILQLSAGEIPENIRLFWAFGGVTGKKFSRDGDLGADPESSFYLKPEYCTDNEYVISENSFTVYYGSGRDKSEAERYENNYTPTKEELERTRLKNKKQLTGIFPPDSQLKVSDANRQNSPAEFLSSNENGAPALAGKMELKPGSVQWFLITNPGAGTAMEYNQLAGLYEQAESLRKKMADRIQIKTPDNFINSAGGALSIGADAIWEEPSYLHGANAWRMRLNGWRGAYTADALGWHDRARMHFSEYAKAQYLEPKSGPNVPDPKTNLSRQEEKIGNSIFTEGYISRNPGKTSNPHHYDMNLVFVDQVLRHFNWTGDTTYLRQMWPMLVRHLAWEKRCFDGNNDGLYDAYCCIWASDALQYSGGGVTHSSAYNYYANKSVAHLATLIGKDPSPYRAEAEKIVKAMNQQLWMPEKGWYAEYKDLLGSGKVHPAAALWTIYHAIDSEVPDPFQAWQCLDYIDHEIPHIPIVPKDLTGSYYTLSTTNWMPYAWSINNVASGEVFHTALAYWQTGRNDEAFRITKSALLDYLYLGKSPGNFGQLSFYDAFRGELYRDFADGIGAASRALVEGLFGIHPDATNGKLIIRPGFPSEWKFASLKTPDISFGFKRENNTDRYTVDPLYFRNLKLVLKVKAQRDQVKSLTVNGLPAKWKMVAEAIGQPELEITCEAAERQEIKIEWNGEYPEMPKILPFHAQGDQLQINTKRATIIDYSDPQQLLLNAKTDQHLFNSVVSGETGNHTAFLKLQQGKMEWWIPISLEVRQPAEIISPKNQPAGNLSFTIRNNTGNAFSGTVYVNSFSQKLILKPLSVSLEIRVSESFLKMGSNQVKVVTGKNIYCKNLVNWNITKKTEVKYETVDLTSQFNDRVTSIFKNKYLSPRSPFPTLSVPTQGIGDWCSFNETEEIDDSGLRSKAGSLNKITLPQGVPFSTPGATGVPNILFTSQWDNYPKEAHVKLSGKASHVYLLMAGSTHHMQSRFDNGEVKIEYLDGTTEKLVLQNPETWWPIEQDYYDDGFAFNPGVSQPVRVYLKTGEVNTRGYQVLNKNKGNKIDGGAATLLDLPLNAEKQLKQLSLKTLANDVVIGLMAITLVR
jgi:hypothetical protein